MLTNEADRPLMILTLELYETVFRLYEHLKKIDETQFTIHGLRFRFYPDDDTKVLAFEVGNEDAHYHFLMKQKGWVTIYEQKGIVKKERFKMGFNVKKTKFIYQGNRDFFMELGQALNELINNDII